MDRRTLLGALALVAFMPATGAAQATVDPDAVLRAERAEILAEQAWLLANQRGDFASAASHLREAARLRDAPADRVHDLLNAGHFHHYANRPLSAVSAFQEAAEAALDMGDVATARGAFMDAAWLAARAGDAVTLGVMLDRAREYGADVVATRR